DLAILDDGGKFAVLGVYAVEPQRVEVALDRVAGNVYQLRGDAQRPGVLGKLYGLRCLALYVEACPASEGKGFPGVGLCFERTSSRTLPALMCCLVSHDNLLYRLLWLGPLLVLAAPGRAVSYVSIYS